MRVLAAGLISGAVILLMAVPASAHVTLHSADAAPGASDAVVAIRVPNEMDNATTTGLEVDFPAATPLIGLYVEPTPGWTFQVTQSNLPKPVTTDDGTITQYVSKVVWSGGAIPVGGYQDFNVDVSQMPDAPSIEVKALQTYSDGTIVRWIDETGPNGQEPDHPAPILKLAAPAASPSAAAAPAVTRVVYRNGRRLAIVALVLSIVALLGVGVVAVIRAGEAPAMSSAAYQEALSAQADGEEPGMPGATLTRHLAACSECQAWVSGLATVSRSARVREAEPVPDLTASILATLPESRRTRVRPWDSWEQSTVPGVIRLTLALVAVAQVIAALPALWGDDMGATIHVAHEQGAWGIALAAGLLFAAWRPSRALAMAPMLAAFVAVLAVLTALDVAAGRVAPSAEVPHLMTAFGVGLLWLEAHPPRMGARVTV